MIKKNLIANYAGALWTALIQLAVLPLYLRYLGIEAYGVLGLHATLIILATFVDLGLTPTLNRGVAKLSGSASTLGEVRGLVRSFELLYWALAVLVLAAALLFLPAFLIAWLKPGPAMSEQLPAVLQLMLVQVGLQTLVGFYTAGLLGLQRHVVLNEINAAAITARSLGGVLLVAAFVPTLQALFLWMIVATVAQLAALAYALHRALPEGRRGFNVDHLRANWRYALGVSGIVALSLFLTQLDKIILSKQVSLAEFGLYSLATTVASILAKPITPLFNTLLPRMTQLAYFEKESELSATYHAGTQLASFLVIPTSVVLLAFAPEALFLWTGDEAIVNATVPMLRWLVIGFSCSTFLMLPYGVSLAYGWTRYGFYQNLISCCVMVPITITLVRNYGAVGGAISWAMLNVSCMVLSVFALHRRFLRSDYKAWYLRDIFPPLASTVAVVLLIRLAAPSGGAAWSLLVIISAYAAAIAASAASLDLIRQNFAVVLHMMQRKGS